LSLSSFIKVSRPRRQNASAMKSGNGSVKSNGNRMISMRKGSAMATMVVAETVVLETVVLETEAKKIGGNDTIEKNANDKNVNNESGASAKNVNDEKATNGGKSLNDNIGNVIAKSVSGVSEKSVNDVSEGNNEVAVGALEQEAEVPAQVQVPVEQVQDSVHNEMKHLSSDKHVRSANASSSRKEKTNNGKITRRRLVLVIPVRMPDNSAKQSGIVKPMRVVWITRRIAVRGMTNMPSRRGHGIEHAWTRRTSVKRKRTHASAQGNSVKMRGTDRKMLVVVCRLTFAEPMPTLRCRRECRLTMHTTIATDGSRRVIPIKVVVARSSEPLVNSGNACKSTRRGWACNCFPAPCPGAETSVG